VVGQWPTFLLTVAPKLWSIGRTHGDGVERLRWLEDRIAPTIEAIGFDVVRVALLDGRRPILQVMADRLDGGMISVKDCSEISHALSAVFDVEEPVSGPYSLEVSSAGIDRPLTRPKDFLAHTGFEARIEVHRAVGGQKRFKGRINGLTEKGDVAVALDDRDVILPMADVKTAQLVLTDELIAATVKQGSPKG